LPGKLETERRSEHARQAGAMLIASTHVALWRASHGSEFVTARTLVVTLGLASVTPRSLGMHLAHMRRCGAVVDGVRVERGRNVHRTATWRLVPHDGSGVAAADPGAPASDETEFSLFDLGA
jgi:hypothetical protein